MEFLKYHVEDLDCHVTEYHFLQFGTEHADNCLLQSVVAETQEKLGIQNIVFEFLDYMDGLHCQEKSIVNADLIDCLGISVEALFCLTPNMAMAFLELDEKAKNDCVPWLDYYCK